MIAAARSSAGKTSIATGLMGALVQHGYRVQGFKVGPDFIDPGYHTAVTGRWSHNLDTWLLPPSQVKKLYEEAVADVDVAVIEGVMGLFDGLRGGGERASTAEMAKLIGCPVILVVDVSSQARSAVAEFMGCRAMDPDLHLAGVILNRVRSSSHLEIVKSSFMEFGIQVFGAVQEGSIPRFPERHLGLVPVIEQHEVKQTFDQLTKMISRQVDLAELLKTAGKAYDISGIKCEERAESHYLKTDFPEYKIRLAYAWDQAFNFYYQAGLNFLRKFGVELVPFSPLNDRKIPPEIGGILIGGGFPELFAEQLTDNSEMLKNLQNAHAQGMPIYTECGGFMFLCENLVDQEGASYPMSGVIPGKCRMKRRLVGMGYRTAQALKPNIFCGTHEVLRGHEFHYSNFIPKQIPFPWAFSLRGNDNKFDGYASGNLLASYLHLHFMSSFQATSNFLDCCHKWFHSRL